MILDIAFVLDSTGSMSSYINTAKGQMVKIADEVSKKKDITKLRFAVIQYRDHPPEDKTFVTKVFDFTDNIKKLKKDISNIEAEGGGDSPEAVADGLNKLLKIDWFSDSVKIAIFIADAPPHGLTNSDRWKECPKGHDPIKIAYECAKRGIIIYSVACEPSVSQQPPTGAFMKAVAEITEGRYVPLTGAHLLPAIIMGAADEESDLEALIAEVEKEMATMHVEPGAEPVSEEEMARLVQENLATRGIKTTQMDYGMDEMPEVKYSSHYVDAGSLKEAAESYPDEMKDEFIFAGKTAKMSRMASMATPDIRPAMSGEIPTGMAETPAGFSDYEQKVEMKKDEISSEQVKRLMGRVKKRKKE